MPKSHFQFAILMQAQLTTFRDENHEEHQISRPEVIETPAEATLYLINDIDKIGLEKTKNDLLATLGSIPQLLDDIYSNNNYVTSSKLDAFINHLDSLEGNEMSNNEVNFLKTSVQRIKTTIGLFN